MTRAEGAFQFGGKRYKLVDLPGTYSLLSASEDEEVARNFLLFGRPDCTVVVVDASALERNLYLVLQVLEITDRVVVAVNLIDEAKRRGIEVDARSLSRDLGVPAVPIVARTSENVMGLLQEVANVASGETVTKPLRSKGTPEFERAVTKLVPMIEAAAPGVPNARWIAIRLLDGDAVGRRSADDRTSRRARGKTANTRSAVQPQDRAAGGAMSDARAVSPADIIREAAALRRSLTSGFREEVVTSLYGEVERVSRRAVRDEGSRPLELDQRIDRIVTSRWLGLPLMLLILAVVFWLTIIGANVPSAMLASALFAVEDWAAAVFTSWGSPWWLTGFIWHGVFRGLAWVISVMLPPMAIFFPLFTILEDLGYLPRVAFNLDYLFKKAGAHGKQALSMAMGFGCNAAGIIATRVIDSPRERLVAILTNNFVPVQRPLPDADHAGHGVRGRGVSAGGGLARGGGLGAGHRGARRDFHARRCRGC